MKKNLWGYLGIILGVIVLDQLTKGFLLYLITGSVIWSGAAWTIVPSPYLMAHVCDFFNIVFTWNPGTAFSLLRSLGEVAPIIIILATALIIGFLGYYLFRYVSRSERFPIALIIGGALGNLIDRLRFGAVIDFLDFHVNSWHWPAFNVADICICVGVGLYLLNLFLAHRHRVKVIK